MSLQPSDEYIIDKLLASVEPVYREMHPEAATEIPEDYVIGESLETYCERLEVRVACLKSLAKAEQHARREAAGQYVALAFRLEDTEAALSNARADVRFLVIALACATLVAFAAIAALIGGGA